MSNQKISSKKRKFEVQYKLIAILIFFFAILLSLALLSFTTADEPAIRQFGMSELFALIGGDTFLEAKAATVHNWLGVTGAYLSNFLYNSTFGYSTILLPLFIVFWGYFIYTGKKVSKRLIKYTSLYLSYMILVASFAGGLQNTESFATIHKEWSGAGGKLLADVFDRIFGITGTLVVFFAIFFLIFSITTNFKHDTLLKAIYIKVKDLTGRFISFSYDFFKSGKLFKPISEYFPEQNSETVQVSEGIAQSTDNTAPIPEEISQTVNQAETIENTVTEVQQPKQNLPQESASIATPRDEIKRPPIQPIIKKPRITYEEDAVFTGSGRDLIESQNSPEIEKMEDVPISHKPLKISINKSSIDSQNDDVNRISKGEELHSVKPDKTNPVHGAITESELEKTVGKQIIREPQVIEEAESDPDINTLNELISSKSNYTEPVKPERREIIPEPEITAPYKPENTTQESKLSLEVDEDFLEEDIPNEDIIEERHLQIKINKEIDEPVLDSPIGTAIHDETINYTPPGIDLLNQSTVQNTVNEDELSTNGQILQEKLETFKIFIENLSITPGPVVTQYEFVPAPGIKISKIESLADDLAMALKARGIRIIAPIPGKGTVGVEIPNANPQTVSFFECISSSKFINSKQNLPVALGKTISGEVYVLDISKMPHLLIAGSTGAGKSVGINTILASLVYKMHPSELKFVIIDPKKVELQQYSALKQHFLAMSPDVKDFIVTKPEDAVSILKSVVAEMELRYDILASVGQRNISDYNERVRAGRFDNNSDMKHRPMPYIVVIIDELADLMLTASKEIEEPITRLAQMARAVGIHLVVATQRPSVDVITGLIKANFPARIAYLVTSKIDSRTILDMQGAEQLLGRGDLLCLPPGEAKPVRIQNSFISTEEVENICDWLANQKGYSEPYYLPSVVEKSDSKAGIDPSDRDPLFEEAARLIIRAQQGSVSLIQRRLKVGYARAGRIVDELEAAGVVGPYDGSRARQVLMESESDLEHVL